METRTCELCGSEAACVMPWGLDALCAGCCALASEDNATPHACGTCVPAPRSES